MTWVAIDPIQDVEASSAFMPRVFTFREDFWMRYLERVDSTASHPDMWDFLASLVLATNAKVIVEAGTYKGHATFAMAESLALAKREGMIYTADVVDHDIGEVLQEAGLSRFVQFYEMRFEEMLKDIDEPIDLAFVDASETENARLRLDYVELLIPKLSPNGVIVVDDSTDDEWPGAKALRDACCLYLPVGRGITLFQTRTV
jgi:predicted O-methyltransferase YrrM